MPFVVDQANKWIKVIEKHNGLKIIKQTDANCMEVIETAITNGSSVLLENIGK